jgi:hypothetical protein
MSATRKKVTGKKPPKMIWLAIDSRGVIWGSFSTKAKALEYVPDPGLKVHRYNLAVRS